MKKKYYWIIGVVVILIILLTLYSYTAFSKYDVEYINRKFVCEEDGGIWIKKGSETECGNLSQEECRKNPNCMAFGKTLGLIQTITFIKCIPYIRCRFWSDEFEGQHN